jgi:hypothetical protein
LIFHAQFGRKLSLGKAHFRAEEPNFLSAQPKSLRWIALSCEPA